MDNSNHADRRMRQRAIPADEVEFIMEEGTPFHAPGGATLLVVTRKDRRQAIEFYRRQIRRLEKTADKAVVLSGDGLVLTVEHRRKRMR